MIGVLLHPLPIHDMTIERSPVVLAGNGSYHISTQKPKNIWYIGIKNPKTSDEHICVEWQFATESKRECIDHDGANTSNEIFSFPVLVDATDRASLHILGSQIDSNDITIYSMDTRASGSRLTLALPSAMAENGIISRAEWGADETMRYTDSSYWQTRYPIYLQYVQSPKTQAQLDAINIENKKVDYLIKNGGAATEIVSLKRTENGHPLVWPIENTRQVSRIVIHHTAQSLDSTKTDAEMIRGIYAYHTLSREWGDIGYNYLIGQRGLIYEGRAGGDYAVASHAAYNNMGTVGISILGDYNRDHLNRDQIAGIERAISMMAGKYGITLSDNKKGVRKCTIANCELFEKLSTKSLMGHEDIGHTDCPGSDTYPRIPDWIARLDRPYAPVYNSVGGTIEPKFPGTEMNMVLRVVTPIAIYPSIVIPPSITAVKYIGPKFRVKLSYPDPTSIVLATADGKTGKLSLDTQKIPMQVSQKVQVGIVGNSTISLKIGEKYYTGSVLRLSHSVVRIDSWDRVPDWDKSGKYNDNLFRDTIRVMGKNGKLVITNDLPLEWYLKGMGEVSNSDLTEKIKTIVVSARSYAKWYMSPQNRKFSGESYDGSDDPDVFQKYLGYSYELRSPSVARVVDMTRGQVITYSGQLIKPWYHSSSDGRTLSALEYCQKNGSLNCVDTPYLQSVVDPGSIGRVRSGHGVGISGVGATYWASSGWDYKKIIQYYLQGVEIQKK
ncbi:N-acetylmuramoyl-L-alanine amidase [Candidatus Gracilibacteria bacterium]|nr:N-acetylmuramoyl-L-alanine amidase [Candidatus Gracilibacteria bacterium]